MDIDANLDILKSELEISIRSSQKHRASDRVKYTFISVYAGVASAITTFSIGATKYLPQEYSNYVAIFSLFTSASVSVFFAWDSAFNHKKLWINSAMALHDLYEIRSDISHYENLKKDISQELVNDFYKRYKEALKNTNSRWLKIRE